MQREAAKYNMKIGLKNSLDIINSVSSFVDFAVNEQCAQLGECQAYANFITLNKPVFHIEYPTPLNPQAVNSVSCKGPGMTGFSTILKDMKLNGITYYCDGSYVDTPTVGGPIPNPSPSRSSSARPTQTPPRSSSTPPRPSSTSRPSPTPSTPGTCRQKHWDQCGGNDWKGCTVCEVSVRSFGAGNDVNVVSCDSHRIHVEVCRRRGITSVCRMTAALGTLLYITSKRYFYYLF